MQSVAGCIQAKSLFYRLLLGPVESTTYFLSFAFLLIIRVRSVYSEFALLQDTLYIYLMRCYSYQYHYKIMLKPCGRNGSDRSNYWKEQVVYMCPPPPSFPVNVAFGCNVYMCVWILVWNHLTKRRGGEGWCVHEWGDQNLAVYPQRNEKDNSQ